jgi:hypothetical protein
VGELGDQLRNEGIPPRNLFRVDEILVALSEEDRKDLLAAIQDASISTAAIVRVLRRNGHSLSENAIRNYRRVNYGFR